jgi:integrase
VEQAGADKGAQEKKKRAANRTLVFVRSLFSQAARRHYTHLVLPANLDEVLDAAIFRKVGKIRKRLPESEVLQRLFTEAGELRETDRNAYIAFLLAAHSGLRLKEIAWARPDWLAAGDPPRMWVKTTEDFIAKSYEERFAEVQPWVFEELSALTAGQPYLLNSDQNMVDGQVRVRLKRRSAKKNASDEREVFVFRRLNAWVKARGFAEAKGEKGVHGLRFLFGAYIANRRSHYTAQKFLGHESVKTTEDHYTDLILDTSLYDLWEKRPAWLEPVK